ncbi:MAG: glycine cleavage system protein GcvH [Acidobacteriota bacterium]
MNVPEELLYSKEHEWIRLEEGEGTLGISDHAQQELGDVVFVELPEPGQNFEAEAPLATLESVKAVSEVYSPLSAEVTAVNDLLLDAPEKINEDPYGEGWIVKLKLKDPTQIDRLLSAGQYRSYLEEESGN